MEIRKRWKKVIIAFLRVIGICICVVLFTFRNELRTMNYMKKINQYPFYEMTYYADYGREELEEQGVNSDEALVSFVTKRLLKGLPLEVNVDGACSAFYVQSPEQEYLLGRNFDYHPSTAMLVKTEPKNGYRSISMVNLAHIGYGNDKQPDSFINKIFTLAAPYIPLDGMNEKGFAIAVLVVEEQKVHQNTGKTPITTTAAIRLLLDNAATVEEAIQILENYDMNSSGDTGYHFFLADVQGNSAVIEYIENEMKVLHNTEEHPFLAATNFSLTTKKQNGGGKDRYEIIQNGLNQSSGVMTKTEVMGLLEEAKFDAMKEVTGGDETSIYFDSATQWSAVYNLTDKVVNICIGTDYAQEYEYSFSR